MNNKLIKISKYAMKEIIMWSFILNLFSCSNPKSQSKAEKISLNKIEEMFANMKANGVNTNQTMLWGYFFIAANQNQFDKIKIDLKNQNFEFVDLFQAEDKTYWFHVERKETHNAKSLYNLDEQLYKLADKYEITYDGFDVGNVDKHKAIERDTYIVPEEFQTYDELKDNFHYLLVGNTAFDRFPHKLEFCYFIKITTTYNTDEKVMLPTKEELNELDKFESFIENNLVQNKIKNYYVFRDTYKGKRNFYIVIKDKQNAEKVIKSIKNSGKQRFFEFEILTDKNWEVYNEFRKKISKS